jgi:hypothetical protein
MTHSSLVALAFSASSWALLAHHSLRGGIRRQRAHQGRAVPSPICPSAMPTILTLTVRGETAQIDILV